MLCFVLPNADPNVKRLLQSGTHADFIITCGEQSWRVHNAIVCKRSRWLRAQKEEFAELKEGSWTLVFKLGDDEGPREGADRISHARILDTYLVWLYTRSFSLVVDNINLSFTEEEADQRLLAFIYLFEFAIRTNRKRQDCEDVGEMDNDELIERLSGKISQMFRDDIEYLARSVLDRNAYPPKDVKTYVKAFVKLYASDGDDGFGATKQKIALQKAVVVHVAFRGSLVHNGLDGWLEGMLDVCQGMKDQLLSTLMDSVNNDDLARIPCEQQDEYGGQQDY